MADPSKNDELNNGKSASETAAGPQPTGGEAVQARVGIEDPTGKTSPQTVAPDAAASRRPWLYGNGPVVVWFLFVVAVTVVSAFFIARGIRGGLHEIGRIDLARLASATSGSGGDGNGSPESTVDPALQGEAETLLQRLATGDPSAPAQVLAETDGWTGKTHRTARTNQFITVCLNRSDRPVREAAVQAQLALDGVPRNDGGLARVEQAVGDADQRAWALWMLGALGNRGIDPNHTARIIEAYLDDSSVQVRGSAVDALSLVGTDETIPMLLDRFRNDPSPIVQERAACDLAQSGMYTQSQRMVAAESLVGWIDDSLLSAQQRGWTIQALSDITGKHFGTDAGAWRSWIDAAKKQTTGKDQV